ncbi:MAG: short-chain dehydrogenase/reductase [Mucilaginibacter sp.]|nr:short-chain dehydrogenase/reductase [Mucilaginibacter sp.]
MKLTNKTILITGGATGIGFALAQALSAQNNQVIITGRRLDKLVEAQQANPGLLYYQSDITAPESIDQLFEQIKRDGIVLDVLYNNAGVIEVWDVAKQNIPSAEIFSKINTNLAGPIAITQNFIRQAHAGKSNLIVNITTEAAIMPVPILPLYSASKAGLSVFTKSLRVQLKGSNFKVVEIIPPAVETKMTTEDLRNTAKLASADDFALNVIRKIEAGKLEYAPSINAVLLNFMRRFFPKAGLGLIDKISRKQLLG